MCVSHPTASAPLRRCNAPRASASTATLSQLTAVSPIDGRYADKTVSLREYCSEFGLIKYRVQVEIAWLLRLAKERILPQLPPFDAASISLLQAMDAGDHERVQVTNIKRKIATHAKKDVRLGASADESKDSAH